MRKFSGLGKEAARVLALAGARVIFTSRESKVGQQVVAELSLEPLKVNRSTAFCHFVMVVSTHHLEHCISRGCISCTTGCMQSIITTAYMLLNSSSRAATMDACNFAPKVMTAVLQSSEMIMTANLQSLQPGTCQVISTHHKNSSSRCASMHANRCRPL